MCDASTHLQKKKHKNTVKTTVSFPKHDYLQKFL